MLAEHESRIGQQFWDGADLVMQVVSDDDRRRDLETKRREYALAHIPEYWIIDPQSMTIVVLALEGGEYQEHGRFATGQAAASRLLSDFRVDVTSVFAAAKRFSES